MNPKRKRRLYTVGFILLAVAGTTTALMLALEQNINMFYPPEEVVSGKAPKGPVIRAGGMVLEGSVERAPDSLAVTFVLSDLAGSDVKVAYEGILPDLFREGQGIVAQGKINPQGIFVAQDRWWEN